MKKATHFVIQYNHLREFKNIDMAHEFQTGVHSLGSLDEMRECIEKSSTFFIAAIFFITLKY